MFPSFEYLMKMILQIQVIQREESQKVHRQASQPKQKDLNLRGKGSKPNV